MRGVGHVVDSSAVSPYSLQSFAQAAPAARVISQLALTLAIAIGGMWAIVNLPRTSEELVAPATAPAARGSGSRLESSEFRIIDPMPEPAVIFIVGSAEAGLELTRALELDAVVRSVTHQRPLGASVTVVESEEQVAAMKLAAGDVTSHAGVVTAVEVIDLR
jgi:hypothetical protein